LEDYNEVAKYSPDNVLVYYNRASIHSQLGNIEEAIEDYSKAISLYPDFANAYLNRSYMRMTLGDMNKAGVEYYIDTLTIYKDAPTVATITFKGEDGTALYAIDAINGEAVAFYGEAPTKENHTFLGWAIEGTTEIVDTFDRRTGQYGGVDPADPIHRIFHQHMLDGEKCSVEGFNGVCACGFIFQLRQCPGGVAGLFVQRGAAAA
jgi:tetratricopeptide (TPR) repeat protein